MDKEVVDFFNSNKDLEHNKDVLPIPHEFENIKSDEEYKKFFHWLRHDSKAKSIRLDINADVTEIQEELKKYEFLAIPHRGHPGWRSLTLFGYSSVMTNSYEFYKSKDLVSDSDMIGWTDICRFFPKTVEWLKKNCPLKEYVRIRLMILDPGGTSSPHKDYPYGQFLCGPVNVAITNPLGSEFVLENGGLVPWREGEFRSMDLGSFHCIRNLSDSPRIHMIITPSKNDWDIDAVKLSYRSFKKMQEEKQ